MIIKNGKMIFHLLMMDLIVKFSNYYSKAYLRHLIKSKEILGLTIASIHNLAFYIWLVRGEATYYCRRFLSWKNEMIPTKSQVIRRPLSQYLNNFSFTFEMFMKKLDWYILKNFLSLFSSACFCLPSLLSRLTAAKKQMIL